MNFEHIEETRYTSPMILRLRVFWIVLLAGFTLYSHGQEPTAMATVVVQRGEVRAVAPGGDSRALVRRSEIYPGETIVTGADGFAQIRFSDRAIVSLSCDSQLQLRDYQYLDRNDDRVHLHLLTGKLRTVTGAIQRRNYRLTTDLAEVQVGGTDYEVVVTEAAHYFGVYDGAISIHNNLGAERIGSDAETDFAQLRMGSAPELIPTAPPQFLSNVTSGGC